MTTQTLIKNIQNSQLAIVPKKQYEEFLKWQKYIVFKPTMSEPKLVKRGGRGIKADKIASWGKVKAGLKKLKLTYADFQEVKKIWSNPPKFITKKDIERWK